MIRTRVREVSEKRGITTAYQSQKAPGISPGTAAKL